jgi:hypothetical protein
MLRRALVILTLLAAIGGSIAAYSALIASSAHAGGCPPCPPKAHSCAAC